MDPLSALRFPLSAKSALVHDYGTSAEARRKQAMAKSRKKKKLTATKLVKAAARAHIGMPPTTRRAPDPTKTDKPKHKPTLGKLLADE